ncbi:MAG: hypothetical protein HLX50_00610 [Alteromonadaceae bacterium]|nr:hypothetical protein [Alteromonadaceae bacterium]
MDYDQEMGGMRDAPVLRFSPQQAEEQARKYLNYPPGARCATHEGQTQGSACVDCKMVKNAAHGMADRRSGRFSPGEITQREKLRECTLCDSRGLAKVPLEDGTGMMLRCPHDPGVLAARKQDALEKAMKKLKIRRQPRSPGAIDYAEEVRKRLQT